MLLVLPLLPACFMDRGFQLIKVRAEENVLPPAFNELLSYVERIWLGRVGAGIWSIGQLQHRTNNSVESWCKTFNANFQESGHPSLYDFLNVLKRTENAQAVKRSSAARTGRPDVRPRKKYVDRDSQIRRAYEKYMQGTPDIWNFLREVSNVSFDVVETARFDQHETSMLISQAYKVSTTDDRALALDRFASMAISNVTLVTAAAKKSHTTKLLGPAGSKNADYKAVIDEIQGREGFLKRTAVIPDSMKDNHVYPDYE
ncbi:hypothetical protein WDU94_010804 [Cyamophila willieti]